MYVVTLPSALIVLQDAAVDIYHRTAVDKILPYTEQFDNISWWMSAGVVNSLCEIIMAPYCMQFTQLLISGINLEKHANYPRGVASNVLYEKSRVWISHYHHSPAIRKRMTGIVSHTHKIVHRFNAAVCEHMPKMANYLELLNNTMADGN